MKYYIKEGFSVEIDEEDLLIVSRYTWHEDKGYAATNIGGRKFYMHQLILGVKHVDHKNQNRADNRKQNLRPANKTQNNANRGKQINNTSGFKGVSWHKQARKWQAKLHFQGKVKSFGLYSDICEAAKAYNRGATKYFGEYACLNEIPSVTPVPTEVGHLQNESRLFPHPELPSTPSLSNLNQPLPESL